MTKRIRTFALLPHGTSVPDNAEVVSKFEGAPRYRQYAVLIEIKDEKASSGESK